MKPVNRGNHRRTKVCNQEIWRGKRKPYGNRGRISNLGHEDGLGIRVTRCLRGKRPRSPPPRTPKGKKLADQQDGCGSSSCARVAPERVRRLGVSGEGTRAEEASSPGPVTSQGAAVRAGPGSDPEPQHGDTGSLRRGGSWEL